MSVRESIDSCVSAETLAAFAEGKLSRQEMEPVLAHLESCPRCLYAVEQTARRIEEQTSSRGRTIWLAAAAAIAALAIALGGLRLFLDRRPTARLVKLAPQSARIVEPRLSGGFGWAPYEGPMRSSAAGADPQRLKLGGAAGEIVEEAEHKKSPELQHAAGVALVLIDQPLAAAERLRAQAERTPNDAKLWSDVAAAEYAAAQQLERPSLYPVALGAADRALAIDPRLPEALFNRALLLERLGMPQPAREAWSRYLAVDSSSAWATEARERLQKLPSTTSEMRFRDDLAKLEAPALVAKYPQQSRALAEVEILGQWATERDGKQLGVARAIGDALVALSGESLLREAVRAIDEGDPGALADAHSMYRRGRIAYSRHEPAAAEKDLRRAAELFATARSPMADVARYYAACTRFDQNDVAGARRELETLLAAADALPRFVAHGAQVRWQLAMCHMINDDWTGALPLLQQAAAAFRRLGERSNLAVIETMLADAMAFLGRPDESWAARIEALAIHAAEGRGDRLPVTIGEAARMELRAGRYDAARALLRVEEESATNDVLRANTLARKASLSTLLGDDEGAARDVRDAFAAARRIKDVAMRDWALADAEFAAGAATLRADARNAAQSLTRAIDHYRGSEKAFFLPEALLLRARARLRIGDRSGARDDLDAGIAAVERHRSRLAGEVVGTGVVDAASELFREAIPLRLDEGDVAGAFAYAERGRRKLAPSAAKLASVDELRTRLAGSDTAVLELVVLPNEVVAFVVDGKGIAATRHPIAREQLAKLADESELYDVLIRPSERALGAAANLIVVADPLLELVPFAALRDSVTQRRVIETRTVSLAPSASALHLAQPASAPTSIVAIALPAGRNAPGLPASGDELREITRHYARSTPIAPAAATFAAFLGAAAGAEIIHIAGHTERQPGVGDPALVFAAAAGGAPEAVSWRGIAEHPLPARIVMLAACETLRAPRAAEARALSLGGGFLAAGAHEVIGTLEPIPDEQARAIFSLVHRDVARGASAAESLRNAQLEGLAAEAAGRRTAWRAVALLTTLIPRRS